MDLISYCKLFGPERILIDRFDSQLQLIKNVTFELCGVPIQKLFADPVDYLSDIIENHPNDLDKELFKLRLANKTTINYDTIKLLRDKYENRVDVTDILDKCC